MKLNRSLKFCLVAVMCFLAFVPKDTDPLDKLVNSLTLWADSVPQEKVYLHMDKPYYAIGDTIWFKAYVTTGSRHQLSAISGALYADLINEEDSVVSELKLPLTAGMTMGDFTLKDQLKEGNYRIRAYTQWMRNAGEDYFFDHTFTVINPFVNEVIAKADYKYSTSDDKQLLNATLNYTDENGTPLINKRITYEVVTESKIQFTKTAVTDEKGNIEVIIPPNKQQKWNGGVIKTTVELPDRVQVEKQFPIKVSMSQSDVQFFPESGNLVCGVASKLAFKAVGIDGNGLAIKGEVFDQEQNHIGDFSTTYAGMGSFIIRPETGKSYNAKITFPDGTQKVVAIPKPLPTGYVLSVFQPNPDSVLVRVNVPEQMLSNPQALNLNCIVHSGGETITATPVKITRPSTSFWVDKKAFPSGIAHFTLFSALGEPLNERIAFIKTNDQLTLKLNTAKQMYSSKERVELELEARDASGRPTAGNFSISVVDETKVPFNQEKESTIFSNLLLTADLKGYIENPGFYFTADNEEVNKALDNLMLTQGYTRFLWSGLKSGTAAKPMFPAEGLGTYITGRVVTLGNKPVANASLMLMSIKAGSVKATSADANGRFKFDGMFLADSVKFAIQARSPKKSNKVEVILDTVPALKSSANRNIGALNTDLYRSVKSYAENTKKQDEVLEERGGLSRVNRLREVNINKQVFQKNLPKQRNYNQNGPGKHDQIVSNEDLQSCPNLIACLEGKLRGVIFKLGLPYSTRATSSLDGKDDPSSSMLVVLDGNPLSPIQNASTIEAIFQFNDPTPNQIASIEVLRSANYTTVYGAPQGVILITTKNGGNHEPAYNPNMVNITPKNFDKAKEFYTPRYDRQGSSDGLPDLRSTVYWNAAVKTYSTGKTTLNLFNADGPGIYKVIIEGINADGQLGRQVYRYTVDASTETQQSGALSSGEKELSAGLDNLRKRLPVEKVYLHTDKPYYNIGDTIWFKSYLVDGANLSPSKQSGLLYVELNNDSSEVVRRISIPLTKGIGWGQIPLPSKIFQEGGYTLRAYTNWMQNFGSDYVFDRRFYLGRPKTDSWIVTSDAEIARVADKDELRVNLSLSNTSKAPVALRDVEVQIYEGDRYLYKEKLQTSLDGKLKFSKILKDKADGRNIRVEVRSLHSADGSQMLQVPLSINRTQKIDLQFLPESGYMVAGIKSIVAFKAIGEDGKSMPVSGTIYDGKGNVVLPFSSSYAGMGRFELLPGTNESYTARLTLTNGEIKSYDLPKVIPQGTTLSVLNEVKSNQLQVKVQTSDNALNSDSTFYLLGTAKGVLYFSQQVSAGQLTFSIPKSKFPNGIVRFTLLRGETPLNERIIFINHQSDLNIHIAQNKPSFLKRDSVSLEIEVKDKSGIPVKGSFSLSVTDDSQVRPDPTGNFSITAGLLLGAELKGNVESPGYYINTNTESAWLDLDNLMLTQGWVGYSWKDVFSNGKTSKFNAEKEFQITGTVTNLLKKPVIGAPVLISSQKPSFITTVNTDDKGRYIFKGLPKIDSGSFFIQARTPKGKEMNFGGITVERFHPLPIEATFRDKVLPWYVNSDSAQINYAKNIAAKGSMGELKQTGIALKEVQITSKKLIPGSSNRNGPGKADLVFDEKEIKASAVMNLYQLIKQKLPGFRVITEDGLPTLRYNRFMVIIEIDGAGLPVALDTPPTEQQLIEELSEYQIAQFVGMEVMYSNKYLSKYVQPYALIPKTPTAKEITDSENNLSAGSYSSSDMIFGEASVVNSLSGDRDNPNTVNQVDQAGNGIGNYYKNSFRPVNYLEARANVLTRKTRELAVIAITTGNKRGWSKILKPDVLTYRPLPLLNPIQFYSPKYSGNFADIAARDYRSTIYWEPNIVTDANGKAKLSFFTSDSKGSYTISVEGFDPNGGLGSSRQKINVK
ncbi:MAG: hypothetical protein V4687_11260 [Bacteroidota bacterium]